MKSARINLVMVGLLSVIGLGAFSIVVSCQHLNPEGPYKGDVFLWNTDGIIVNSYFIVDAFLRWEVWNRASLKDSPEIKQFADKLRAEYPIYHKEALALRDIYANISSEQNREKLTQALEKIHDSVLQISKYQKSTSPELK